MSRVAAICHTFVNFGSGVMPGDLIVELRSSRSLFSFVVFDRVVERADFEFSLGFSFCLFRLLDLSLSIVSLLSSTVDILILLL